MKSCKICGAIFFPKNYRQIICSNECKKTYHQVYSWTQQRAKNNIRASGGKYINPPEKIQAIKEKYKNGVSVEIIKQMME